MATTNLKSIKATAITPVLNTAGASGSKGDIGVVTRGMVANDSYTMVIELRKDNTHYQRGQFTDPGAFNYGGARAFGNCNEYGGAVN